MKLGRVAVQAGVQNSSDQQNLVNTNLLFNQLKPEIPDLTYLSKGQLKKTIESLCWEIAKLKNPTSPQLSSSGELEFTQGNFNYFVSEVIKLRDEKLKDQEKIDSQQNMIISLLSNTTGSHLKIA